jgi:TetR/AcrR family transcriptional regulator, transcriptional repressor for nem operon
MGHVTTGTKQKLIETALKLLWTHSYGSVSVDDICKDAGAKKGSFYHFFPSKAELAIAAMEENYQNSKSSYDEIFSADKDPVARFESLADFLYAEQSKAAAKYGHVCGCPCASLGSEIAGQEEGIRTKFEEFSRRLERYYENALRDMVAEGLLPDSTNVKSLAQEIFTYILGQLMHARIQNNLQYLKQELKPGLLRILGVENKSHQPANLA